jgi:hypothetical protein
VTPHSVWRRTLADRTPEELQTARKTYQEVLDLCEKFPEISSPELHDNAITVLREIDAILRRRAVKRSQPHPEEIWLLVSRGEYMTWHFYTEKDAKDWAERMYPLETFPPVSYVRKKDIDR